MIFFISSPKTCSMTFWKFGSILVNSSAYLLLSLLGICHRLVSGDMFLHLTKKNKKKSPISYLILDMNLRKLYGLYLFYYPHGDVNLHLTFSNPRQVLPIYWNLFKDEFHWFSVLYLLLAQNVFFSNLHASWYKQLHISIQL